MARRLSRDREDHFAITPYKIKRNRIKCKSCGDVIESKHTHHLVFCSCGMCGVDGGKSYIKRAYKTEKPEDAFIELTEYEDYKEDQA